MSLSQDEITALLSGDDTQGDDAAPLPDADDVEIMSPEDITAMLDGNAEDIPDGSAETDLSDSGGFGPDLDIPSDDEIEILPPEDIAAMLEVEADALPVIDESVLSAEDVSAMLENAENIPAAASEAAASAPKISSPLKRDSEIDDKLFGQPLEGMLTDRQVDILGEIGNISMGAVATTMFSLLDRRVDITTPHVSVYNSEDVLKVYEKPFVVSIIEYVEGIRGRNLLVLKINDAALITDLLVGGDGNIEPPTTILDDFHLSAMSEIMNQMMGASSTALSKLFKRTINISPPTSSHVDVGFDITGLLGKTDSITKISFDMEIEGLLHSELLQLIPYDVSIEFAEMFSGKADFITGPIENNDKSTLPPAGLPYQASPHSESLAAASATAAAAMAAVSTHPGVPDPAAHQVPLPPGAAYPPPYPYQPHHPPHPPPGAAPYPYQGVVDVHPVQFQTFDAPSGPGEQKGIELVYNIPLQVTVELGKAKKEVSEILEFSTGTIVVLDKIAGDPVEIVVNGKLIARGEVVVIDENYGVRITGLIQS